LDFNPLLDKYRKLGFTIAAFPCNQFDGQEPGENDELLNGLKYVRPGKGWEAGANMKIFGKLKVNGKDAHPMYQFLRSVCPHTVDLLGDKVDMHWDPITVRDLTWNFEKFLIDRQGRPRFRFHPGNWNRGVVVESYLSQLLAESQTSYDQPIQNIQFAPQFRTANDNSISEGFQNFWRMITGQNSKPQM